MAGIVVYTSLRAAVKDGYEIYDRTADGYLIRIRTPHGWALALAQRTA
jgi:hypothetical protein